MNILNSMSSFMVRMVSLCFKLDINIINISYRNFLIHRLFDYLPFSDNTCKCIYLWSDDISCVLVVILCLIILFGKLDRCVLLECLYVVSCGICMTLNYVDDDYILYNACSVH